jgi:carbon monoxide dehydrogenase subunit G
MNIVAIEEVKNSMDITGSQKIKVSREQVFQALLNPEALKNSIPGCQSAELVDTPIGQQLKVKVSPNFPGMKGSYKVFLRTAEVMPPSHLVFITEPSSSLGSIKAICGIDLTEDVEGTTLTYNAHAEMEGKIAATPEMIVKGAVKVALDQFFKNFEKQASSIYA